MEVEIKSEVLSFLRNGTNGKTYGKQDAALHDGGDFPLPFQISVEQGKQYKPGRYKFGRGSFGTNKFKELSLGFLRLEPITPATAK